MINTKNCSTTANKGSASLRYRCRVRELSCSSHDFTSCDISARLPKWAHQLRNLGSANICQRSVDKHLRLPTSLSIDSGKWILPVDASPESGLSALIYHPDLPIHSRLITIQSADIRLLLRPLYRILYLLARV